MIISRKEYEQLSQEEKNSITYSNPCSTGDPDTIRVGEVLDSDLGHWRSATERDF